MQPPFEILFEDNHLLVVNKPAKLPTMGVAADRPSVLSLAKQYIAKAYNKPGKVYLGIVSRLDAPVTGVLLIARTSKAAGRLSEAFRNRTVEKTYWACVDGVISPPEGSLTHHVRKHERHRKVLVVPAQSAGAQEARLRYRTLAVSANRSLLEIKLETGRKHQIRVQLSAQGHAIVGDRKYDSELPFSSGIALHSRRLAIEHPVRKTPVVIETPPPKSWNSLPFQF